MINNVNSIASRPLYTKNEAAREVKSAAMSAGLSAGVTLALNKGQCPKTAVKVGLLAGGISLALGVIGQLISKAKADVAAKASKGR